MREHHIRVPRTALYWTLGEDDAPDEVWFVLHGYRQLAHRFLRRFRPLADGSRLIVAPEAFSRFYVESEPGRHGPESLVGASWMTRHDRDAEIRDYVGYLDRLADRVLNDFEGRSVTVLGFSQGLHTAARWAVLGEVSPDRLILWGDYFPSDLDMTEVGARLAEVEVVFVVGENDPTRRDDLTEAHDRRMQASGLRTRTLTHPGGHELDPELLERLAGESGGG